MAGKSEKFGYVATSPDGTFVIAAGVVEGEKVFYQFFVLEIYFR